jgi:hypothetical protein
MRSFLRRVEKLESDNQNKKAENIAFITYDEGPSNKERAIKEWETENGPISECFAVFFTTYEARPE